MRHRQYVTGRCSRCVDQRGLACLLIAGSRSKGRLTDLLGKPHRAPVLHERVVAPGQPAAGAVVLGVSLAWVVTAVPDSPTDLSIPHRDPLPLDNQLERLPNPITDAGREMPPQFLRAAAGNFPD